MRRTYGKGRKGQKELRDMDIHIRCTETELEHIKSRAAKYDMPVSEFVRTVASGRPVMVLDADFGKMVQLLSNLTNNVNQIARYANQNRHIDDLAEVRKMVSETTQRLNNAIESIREKEEL